MNAIKRSLKLILPMCPLSLTIYIALALPTAFLPAVLLYVEKKIVDGATAIKAYPTFQDYGWYIVLLIVVFAVWKTFDIISRQYMEFGYFRYIMLALDKKIHDKCALLSLECYDDAKLYQHVEEAKEASMFLIFTVNLVVQMMILFFTMLSIGSYLAALHPLLIVFLLLLTLPVLLEKYEDAKLQTLRIKNSVQPQREKQYYLSLLTSAATKKEISIHGAGNFIAEKYLFACRKFDKEEESYGRKVCAIGVCLALQKTLIRALSVGLMVYLLITGRITIGGFSVVMTSFLMLTNTFERLFQFAGEIGKTGKMADGFFTLMDLEVLQPAGSLKETGKEFLRFEHVFYRYSSAKQYALQDITFSVNQGEVLAIVGENGAGKSTLAKLMAGFLLPTQGTMYCHGRNRVKLSEQELLKNQTALYQEYGRYMLSLADNIYLSDLDKPFDLEGIKEALHWSDFPIQREEIENVMLGKEFGGVDLSGGQWQRIALARAYYRNRPIVFFDEPTAAIDPLQETALYEKIKALAKGKTIIIVTHRLGFAKAADKLLVLENGSIKEQGDFDTLMRQDGRFAFMWREQLKWYGGINNI